MRTILEVVALLQISCIIFAIIQVCFEHKETLFRTMDDGFYYTLLFCIGILAICKEVEKGRKLK